MNKITQWIARIIAAVIMLQTLYFKFTGDEESVYIFTQVGMEPWGRIGVGVMELIASALIIIPSTVWLGAALAIGLMFGAIVLHLTWLGVEIKGDGGYLFYLALIVAISSAYAYWGAKSQQPEFVKRYLPSFLK